MGGGCTGGGCIGSASCGACCADGGGIGCIGIVRGAAGCAGTFKMLPSISTVIESNAVRILVFMTICPFKLSQKMPGYYHVYKCIFAYLMPVQILRFVVKNDLPQGAKCNGSARRLQIAKKNRFN